MAFKTVQTITPIIGLEIHVQLRTRTKMFCGCPGALEAPPNSCVCPICLGRPGALPVINRQAVHHAITAGLALNCRVAEFTKWDRKSYYYPDMPKNYQISQYDLPICSDGWFEILVDGRQHRVRIRRAHLEEDAGKNMHDMAGGTGVDLNRAGAPLLEIVTEPDLHSAEDTYVFCTELQKLVTYLGVSEGNMKKGQMRFEPNVNLKIEHGDGEFHTPIAEIKNLNSFRSVRDAVAFEILRQVEAWQADNHYTLGVADNENRGWDDDRAITVYQRPKEAAHDYRYFPDPDLVPVTITSDEIDAFRAAMPELPAARASRLRQQLGLEPADIGTLLADRQTADLFEQVILLGGPVVTVAKQFVNVWMKLANERGKTVCDLTLRAEHMAELARMTDEKIVSKTAANQIAEAMVAQPDDPMALAQTLGLLQVRDESQTLRWIQQAMSANEKAVRDAQSNPKKAKAAVGFLRGQVMKLSGGQADPTLVGKLIEEQLERLGG